MNKAGSAEPKAIRDAIEQTTGYAGLNGMFNMSKKDHLGLDIDSGIKMLAIKNGDWTLAK